MPSRRLPCQIINCNEKKKRERPDFTLLQDSSSEFCRCTGRDRLHNVQRTSANRLGATNTDAPRLQSPVADR